MGAKCQHCQQENDGWVPLARLSQETAKVQAAEANAAKAALAKEKADAALQAAVESGSTAATELAAMTAKFQATEAAHSTEMVMVNHGLVDPTARAVAGFLHQQLPEAERPTMADWLGGFKADPSTAPTPLSPYLSPPAAAPPPATDSAPAPPAGLPPANTGVKPPPIPTAKITDEQIRNMTTEEYRQHRETIAAQRGYTLPDTDGASVRR